MNTADQPSDLYDFAPAVLRGALAASLAGGAGFAIWFVAIFLASPFATPATIPDILFSGAFWVAFLAVAALVVTGPVTLVCGGMAYLILRRSKLMSIQSFAIGGFVVGTALWAAGMLAIPPEQLILGNPMSAPTIGGLAGLAGGRAFARRMMQAT